MKSSLLYYSSVFLISLLIVSYLISEKERYKRNELKISQHSVQESPVELLQPKASFEGFRKMENDYFQKIENLIANASLKFEYEIVNTSQPTNHFKISNEEGIELNTEMASSMIKYQLLNDSPDSIYYLVYSCDFGGGNLMMDRTFFRESATILCNASIPVKEVILPFSKKEYVVNIAKIYESPKKINSKEIKYYFTPIPPNISTEYLRSVGVPDLFFSKTKVLRKRHIY